MRLRDRFISNMNFRSIWSSIGACRLAVGLAVIATQQERPRRLCRAKRAQLRSESVELRLTFGRLRQGIRHGSSTEMYCFSACFGDSGRSSCTSVCESGLSEITRLLSSPGMLSSPGITILHLLLSLSLEHAFERKAYIIFSKFT